MRQEWYDFNHELDQDINVKALYSITIHPMRAMIHF